MPMMGGGPGMMGGCGCGQGGTGVCFIDECDEEQLEPKVEEPECTTNQIIVLGRCQCPDNLIENPDKSKTSEPVTNTHYIFALDRSGSMVFQ